MKPLKKSAGKLPKKTSARPKPLHTAEIRVYASDEVKFKIVKEVKKELSKKYPVINIDGVRVVFPKGQGLVRASKTQKLLFLRFEGETEEDRKSIEREVKQAVENAIKRLGHG